MEFIIAIHKLLRHQVPQPEASFLPEGKMKQLYQAMAKGKVNTDREAVQHIYGHSAQPQEKKFLLLKKDLEERLVDRLLQFHTRPNHVQQRIDTSHIKLWCRKQMILSELLLAHNLHLHAEKILLKISTQAEKLLLYHILEECWLLLRQVHMLKGEAKELSVYDKKIANLHEEKRLLNQASGLYELLQVQANRTIVNSKNLARQASEHAATVAIWLGINANPYLELLYYDIRTIEHTNHPDTDKLQALIKEKTAFIKRHKKFRNPQQLAEINLTRIYLCQAKGNLRSALRYVLRILTYQGLHWNLWLSIQEKAFVIYMNTGEYEKAGEILQRALRTSQAQLLNPFQESQWFLWEAYLYYMLMHQEKAEEIKVFTPNFAGNINLADFDRRTMPLANDKKGYQVQVLIMRTLLLHKTGKGSMSYHAKSLRRYYQRHLTDLADIKTKLFFQIIAQAAAVDFAWDKTIQRTYSLVQELENMPNHFHEKQELVPYKTLWGIVRDKISIN